MKISPFICETSGFFSGGTHLQHSPGPGSTFTSPCDKNIQQVI